MIDRTFPPHAILSNVVEFYFYYKIDAGLPAVQQYATPLMQGLVFNFNQQPQHHTFNGSTLTLDQKAYIFGQSTCPRVVSGDQNGVEIMGVKFKPLGLAKITGINMAHMADRIIAAEDIWGREFESLCDQMQSARFIDAAIEILQQFLIGKYIHTTLHHHIDTADYALSMVEQQLGNISIRALQGKTHTSRKTLERVFMHAVGLHPKLYARIVRFNAVKDKIDRHIKGVRMSAVAQDFGYYDSAHFTAEFKHFSSVTPKVYVDSMRHLFFTTEL